MSEGWDQAGPKAWRERNDLVEAIHRLENAVGRAAPGREEEWASEVRQDMRSVYEALQAHREAAEKQGGLYEQIEREAPQFVRRLEYMRSTNRQLINRSRLLLEEVTENLDGEAMPFMAVREHAIDLMSAIRHQQAREVDLVYEAFSHDLGAPD